MIAVLAVYGPPIVGAQSHLAVEKVVTAMPAMRALLSASCPSQHLDVQTKPHSMPLRQLLDYLNDNIGKQGAGS